MHSQNSVGAPTAARVAVSSRFRIVCHQADGSVGLLTLCQSLSEARRRARNEVDHHLAILRQFRLEVLLDSKRPAQISVEQWVGDATNGSWKSIERNEGGYQFTFYDSPPRKFRPPPAKHGSVNGSHKEGQPVNGSVASSAPRCGDMVECVLLDRRTRKKGWFAKIAVLPASGPVTGAPPVGRELEPGMKMVLRVCSCKLSTGAAQLAWPS